MALESIHMISKTQSSSCFQSEQARNRLSKLEVVTNEQSIHKLYVCMHLFICLCLFVFRMGCCYGLERCPIRRGKAENGYGTDVLS